MRYASETLSADFNNLGLSGWTVYDWGSHFFMDGMAVVYLLVLIFLSKLSFDYVERPGQRAANAIVMAIGNRRDQWAKRRARAV